MSNPQVSSAKANSLLSQQLDQSKSTGSPVQAWFQLKAASGAPAARDVTSLTNSIVQRVQDHVGETAESVKILSNLNSFMVSAHPDIIRELIKQPEIESARSTNVPNFGLIRPVKSQPVNLQAISPKKRRSSPKKRRSRVRKASR